MRGVFLWRTPLEGTSISKQWNNPRSIVEEYYGLKEDCPITIGNFDASKRRRYL